jgi:hypothetical protein
VFSEDRHAYSLDGKAVPSVTTVTGKAIAKPGMVAAAAKEAALWAAAHQDDLAVLGPDSWQREAATAHTRAWNRARDDGTTLHGLAEKLLYGDPLPAEGPDGLPFPDEMLRMAKQAARFMDAWDVDPVLHEALVFHETDRWAGRLDLVADLRGGDRWLLDWKTGRTGIWPETSMQLTAYAHATHVQVGDHDAPMPPVQHTAAVWIRPDTWELVPVRNDDQVYGVFLHAMAVAEWAGLRRADSVAAPMAVPA